MNPTLDRKHAAALAALGFILAVTAAWWALALWPVPGEVPEWLAVTRAACFGSAPNGLPAPAGWLLLIGQPPAMLIALMLVAGESLPGAIQRLAARPPGRLALAASSALLVAGFAAAGVRVARASSVPADLRAAEAAWEPVDRPAPALGLVDQYGQTLSLERLRGRPAIVTFAFAHCATACPLIIQEIRRTRALVGNDPLAVVVVTLDPWRDTPTRLASIWQNWSLGPDSYVLGGSIAQITRTLEDWDVAWSRDPLTGDVAHSTPVYLLGPDTRLAYRAGAVADTLARLLGTL